MIYILIPSYNDGSHFPMLLQNIKKKLTKRYRVIIIDDGSTDQTKKIIAKLTQKYPLKYMGYEKNHGPGFAFRFGFNYLIPKLKNNDIVVTMEADNSSDYSILNKMIDKTKTHDVVLASPYAKGGKLKKVPFLRAVLSRLANLLDSLIFKVPGVKTYSSFYRVHRGLVLKNVFTVYGTRLITEEGFAVFVELLVKFNKTHAAICEIPAVVTWEYRKSKSKMNITKSTLEHFILYINYFRGKYSI